MAPLCCPLLLPDSPSVAVYPRGTPPSCSPQISLRVLSFLWLPHPAMRIQLAATVAAHPVGGDGGCGVGAGVASGGCDRPHRAPHMFAEDLGAGGRECRAEAAAWQAACGCADPRWRLGRRGVPPRPGNVVAAFHRHDPAGVAGMGMRAQQHGNSTLHCRPCRCAEHGNPIFGVQLLLCI